MINDFEFGELWVELLCNLIDYGREVSPRGLASREILGVTLRLDDPRNNVLVHYLRKLNYRFMVAEWLWIWFGREDVATIARYNSKIASFSDDGVKFAGAYGPRVFHQVDRVVRQLKNDPSSRQAVITIFSPADVDRGLPKTKDVPCTLTLQFFLRDAKLYTIVNMRSSDAWLGLPYDVFNFSMIANVLAVMLEVELGWLQLNLGSSHLYDRDYDAAQRVTTEGSQGWCSSPRLTDEPPRWLEHVLTTGGFDDKMTIAAPTPIEPWLTYAKVLTAPTQVQALSLLRGLTGSWPKEAR